MASRSLFLPWSCRPPRDLCFFFAGLDSVPDLPSAIGRFFALAMVGCVWMSVAERRETLGLRNLYSRSDVKGSGSKASCVGDKLNVYCREFGKACLGMIRHNGKSRFRFHIVSTGM